MNNTYEIPKRAAICYGPRNWLLFNEAAARLIWDPADSPAPRIRHSSTGTVSAVQGTGNWGTRHGSEEGDFVQIWRAAVVDSYVDGQRPWGWVPVRQVGDTESVIEHDPDGELWGIQDVFLSFKIPSLDNLVYG